MPSDNPGKKGMAARRVNILGVEISAVNIAQTLTIFTEWIEGKSRQYVCVTPAHAVMDCYRDPGLQTIFNQSGLTTPDGMAIVWLLRLYGEKGVSRVYGPDLMRAVCALSVANGWRHFLYGGDSGVAECLKSRLEEQYAGIQVVGVWCPPFRALTDEEDRQVIASINAANADIVWVGLSSPKQERWMSEHLAKVNVSVMVGVGAAFDFVSGCKPQAPLWIQRLGFEWLFRLLSEPGRLWPRYSQYPLFVLLVLAQFLGLKRFSSGKSGL